MAERDASRVQLDFPQLTADIIAQLRLTGVVGLLDFLDQIRPVYIVATRAGALDVIATAPLFQSAEITHASVTNAPANAIIGDTGQLAAGDYDIFGSISQRASGGNAPIALQHRDAADLVTLATLLSVIVDGGTLSGELALAHMGYTIGLNERLRFQNTGTVLSGSVSTVVGARLRPTP